MVPCEKVYKGQTGKTWEHRLNENKRALTSGDYIYNTSAVADHAVNKPQHCMDKCEGG